jgi:hypothetical protein
MICKVIDRLIIDAAHSAVVAVTGRAAPVALYLAIPVR